MSMVKSLEDVMSDGEFHPIMSGVSINGKNPTTFWVSELPEHPFKDEVDHSNADCFRVDLQPEAMAREGYDASVIGHVALIGADIQLQLLTVDDRAYLINKTLSDQRYKEREEAKRREQYQQRVAQSAALSGEIEIPF